ncbi:MAG: sensor histidine kinase [Cyclobacteriaceae bacterium]|nr:sensor histidine kinase [Cyclobacteriaceae bacterium]
MKPSFQSIFKSSILFHVAGWIIFFIAPLLLSPPNEFESILTDTGTLESMLIRNLVLMGLFYFNLLFLAPVVLKNNSIGVFLFILIAFIIGVSLLNLKIHHFFSEDFGDPFRQGPPPEPPNGDFGPGGDPNMSSGRRFRPMMFPGPLFSSFLITIIIVSISTSLVLWKDWVKAKATEQERAFQKLASELAVLKLQISPHFLFNTLNNIRWLVRSKSDQAEEAVIKLSQLLRYILYQTDLEKVALEKEIQNLKDYISLQQMRLTEHQSIQYFFQEDSGNKSIVPLLFIPLVENVFKYGDFAGSFQNKIELTVSKDLLTFQTENLILKTLPVVNKQESGIGLTNVKKRLMLHYQDKHSLVSSEANGIFRLKLEIILT